MLNLSLEQVMQYAKDYKAVPVAKECLADMLTPLAFFGQCKTQQPQLLPFGKH